jgi:diguanylate cyclase (GGDEF)-like protein
VLIECVKNIQSRLRESDIFGRLGGEEFGALLVETSLEGAVQLAERLRLAVEDMAVQYDGREIRVTVSIGCSAWDSSEVGINEVLKNADQALYAAKNKGRNRVEAC